MSTAAAPPPPSAAPLLSPLRMDAIHRGDCVKLLRKLDAESIDLAFADPPYNIGFKYDQYRDNHEDEVYLAWCEEWIAELHRVVKPTGAFWLAIGDEYAAELKVAAQRLGFATRNWVVWYYTFGQNCRRKFNRSHAHLFHFVKDEERHTFNAADPALRIPSARALVYGDRRANLTGRLPDDLWIIPPVAENAECGVQRADYTPDSELQSPRERVTPQSEIRNPNSFVLRPQDLRDDPAAFHPLDDTWYFSRVAGTFKERQGFHGCQMPEQLLGRIVRASSNPGELVLDPFAGSGTTLAVAKKLGRRWMGFELSDAYVKYATQRIEGAEVGEELSGPADPVRSAPTTAAGRRLKGHPMAEVAPAVAPRAQRAEALPDPEPPGAATRPAPIPPEPVAPVAPVAPAPATIAPSPAPSLRDLTRDALVAAYHAAAEGQSLDWLLCTPTRQGAFHAACDEAGLLGGPYDWNRALLKLRKTGALGGDAATSRGRTTVARVRRSDRGAQAPYAAEYAWALVRARHPGASLDDVLCDPAKLALFDESALLAAGGGDLAGLRWEALRLRKDAKRLKAEAKRFAYVARKPVEAVRRERLKKLTARAAKGLAGVGGVYVVAGAARLAEGAAAYIGSADNLGERLRAHLAAPLGEGDAWFVATPDDALPSPDYREAFRWNLAHALRPVWSIDLLDGSTNL